MVSPRKPIRFTEECVYTILHSRDLDKIYRSGGRGDFREGKRWAFAMKLLSAAKKAGKVVPVIFAPGEEIWDLTYVAALEEVKITEDSEGKSATTVSISRLTKFRNPLYNKTDLIVRSTGQNLDPNHIRPYVLVFTPGFLPKLAK
jgi:hypothetical protein